MHKYLLNNKLFLLSSLGLLSILCVIGYRFYQTRAAHSHSSTTLSNPSARKLPQDNAQTTDEIEYVRIEFDGSTPNHYDDINSNNSRITETEEEYYKKQHPIHFFKWLLSQKRENEAIALIKDKGLKINAIYINYLLQADNVFSLLTIAALHDAGNVIDYLLGNGANEKIFNCCNRRILENALMIAAKNGRTKAVAALLKSKYVDLKFTDSLGNNTLALSILNIDNVDIVKLLVKAGADINTLCNFYQDAYTSSGDVFKEKLSCCIAETAACFGRLKVFEYLCEEPNFKLSINMFIGAGQHFLKYQTICLSTYRTDQEFDQAMDNSSHGKIFKILAKKFALDLLTSIKVEGDHLIITPNPAQAEFLTKLRSTYTHKGTKYHIEVSKRVSENHTEYDVSSTLPNIDTECKKTAFDLLCSVMLEGTEKTITLTNAKRILFQKSLASAKDQSKAK